MEVKGSPVASAVGVSLVSEDVECFEIKRWPCERHMVEQELECVIGCHVTVNEQLKGLFCP